MFIGRPERRPMPLAFLAICLLLIAPTSHARADTPLDFLVQQVCDDGSGGHTSADPVTCPATARKLKIGESLPYHKWDIGGGQISDSYPIAELGGRLRVVQTAFFDSQTSFVPPVFDAADPATGRSGYDLLLADGAYVSAAGTYDPGAGWQPIWNNSACSLADSWVYAPKTLTVPFSYGDTTTSLNVSSPQCPPNSNFGMSYTGWNYYPLMKYESGKNLNTIKIWHFSGQSVNSSGIEEFYFTKEYGKTRWEAWSSTVSAANSSVVSRCPTGTNSGTVIFGSTTYYLVDCHDWSTAIPSATGDWYQASSWHIDPLYYSLNILKNTHMQCTNNSGASGQCGASYSCGTILPWNRTGNLNWGYDQNVQAPNSSSNCALILSIPDGPNGQSVYQDVTSIPSGYSTYSFGAALWTPNGSALGATVAVDEIDNSGSVIAQHGASATVTRQRRYIQGTFSISSATKALRFEIRPTSTSYTYEFTEAWIAPQP